MIAITICATESYCYALPECLRAIAANLHACKEEQGHLILANDGSEKAIECAKLAATLFPQAWDISSVNVVPDQPKNYEKKAQLTIASLRGAAFSEARRIGATECWSVDSDVIVPPNALRIMRQALQFDDGYYSVATCPYPSAGGGGFLFGRGTATRHICEDVGEDERDIPADLAAEWQAHKDALRNKDIVNDPVTDPEDVKKRYETWEAKNQELQKRIKDCPPKGNVWALNATKWRRRGWGDMAYPAIGRGSMVPTDWCGFGCTLMNARALSLASFVGYEGRGTEDLWVVWSRWYPAGIKIAALPHALCHHVVRTPKHFPTKSEFTLVYAYHETEGETVGHLRLRHIPWES